ncbi:MAG: DUF4326 domain-containing protein [Inquilinus sp.]|uniref:DUF4326 domain-containing protein n=1 Tax=Inquilinus sp. TaxID=1932117 RepID=UPI003F2F450E
MPKRIRLSRAKGWRKPATCKVVSRPSCHGNPWPVARVRRALVEAMDWSSIGGNALWDAVHAPFLSGAPWTRGLSIDLDLDRIAQAVSVHLFRCLADEFRAADPVAFERWIAPLRGHDLGCWCQLDRPCHADVLLELANGVSPEPLPRDNPDEAQHG